NVHAREIESENFNLKDKAVKQIQEESLMLVDKYTACFQQIHEQFIGMVVYLSVTPIGNRINSAFCTCDDMINAFKCKAPFKPANVTVVTFQQCLLQPLCYTHRDFMCDIRVAVAITTRPETDFEQIVICPVFELHVKPTHQLCNDFGNDVVKHILQEPAQAHCLIVRRRLFLVDERRFAKLAQKQVDIFEFVFTDHHFEIVDDREHVARVELCRVCR